MPKGLARVIPALLCTCLVGCPPPKGRDANSKAEVFRSIGVTRVKLDFVDRPAVEIVAGLAERSHLPIALDEGRSPRDEPLGLGPLSLTEAEPVPFWEALERVIRPAGLQIQTERGLSGPVTLKLGPLRGVRGPVHIDGAFRSEVLSIDHLRNLALSKPDPPRSPGRPVPTRRGDSGPDVGPTRESLKVQVRIRPEPRPGFKLISAGTPRVVQATDERGRSLVGGTDIRALDAHLITGGIGAWVAVVSLALPDPPGNSIAILKGVAPMVVKVSRPDVLDVPLINPVGQTFQGSGARMQVLQFERTGSGPAAKGLVELVIQTGDAPGPPQMPDYEMVAFFDDQGRTIPVLPSGRPDPKGGMRMTYQFPAKSPARVRVASTIEASVEVNFEFTNLPLP